MRLHSWWSSARRSSYRGPAGRFRHTRVPALECLEERTLLAAGALDLTFGDNGRLEIPLPQSPFLEVADVVAEPDGTVVLLHPGRSVGGNRQLGLSRLAHDGTVLQSVSTSVSLSVMGGRLARQPDGKWVVAGTSGQDFLVARFRSNFTLDPTFGIGGLVITDMGGVDIARDLAIQSDGRIVVVGETLQQGDRLIALARYLPDGSLDHDFDADGKLVSDLSAAFDTARAVGLLPDGKILVGGTTGAFNVPQHAFIARYFPDGSLDPAFGNAGRVFPPSSVGTIEDLVVTPDGGMLAAGTLNNDFALYRFDADGGLSSFFGTGGVVTTDFAASVDEALRLAVQLNGKIIVGGTTNASGNGIRSFALARYLHTGTLDTSFSFDGKVITDFLHRDQFGGLLIMPTGEILAAGLSRPLSAFDSPQISLARYQGDPTPVLAIDDVTLLEGDAGGATAVFTVSLSEVVSIPVTVQFSTRNGTAVAPSDYLATSGTLGFAPGQLSRTVTVQIQGDTIEESNQTFHVDLSSPRNAAIVDPTGTATICDDDHARSTLRGSVYRDTNFNGVRDPGESGISGVTVRLLRRGPTTFYAPFATTTTNANGDYAFTGLFAGDYAIAEVQPSNVIDLSDSAGVLGGVVENDLISQIHVPLGVDAPGYNFGEFGLVLIPRLPPLFPNRQITTPVSEGGTAVLTGMIVDPNPRDQFILEIDWGDGTALERHRYGPGRNGDVISIPHRYRDNGIYTVRLSWRDQHGLGNSGELQVEVQNVPPQADLPPDVTLGAAGLLVRPVLIDDPGADQWTVRVDFGDGAVEEFPVDRGMFLLRHRYTAPGMYQVTVAVIDDDGDTGTARFTVTVRGSGQKGPASLDALDSWFAFLDGELDVEDLLLRRTG